MPDRRAGEERGGDGDGACIMRNSSAALMPVALADALPDAYASPRSGDCLRATAAVAAAGT